MWGLEHEACRDCFSRVNIPPIANTWVDEAQWEFFVTSPNPESKGVFFLKGLTLTQ